jgi:hypothetical protein
MCQGSTWYLLFSALWRSGGSGSERKSRELSHHHSYYLSVPAHGGSRVTACFAPSLLLFCALFQVTRPLRPEDAVVVRIFKTAARTCGSSVHLHCVPLGRGCLVGSHASVAAHSLRRSAKLLRTFEKLLGRPCRDGSLLLEGRRSWSRDRRTRSLDRLQQWLSC